MWWPVSSDKYNCLCSNVRPMASMSEVAILADVIGVDTSGDMTAGLTTCVSGEHVTVLEVTLLDATLDASVVVVTADVVMREK